MKSKFVLLKSKDDYSYSHYPASPLSIMTGFVGTAGEGILDGEGHITLFVDPRYHIQADIQTKGKDVTVVKTDSQFGFVFYLKNFLPKNSVLEVPEKSTGFSFYKKLQKELEGIEIIPYKTEEDFSSIDNAESPVFEVPVEIAGETANMKIKKLKKENFLITNLEEIAYLLNLRSFKTKETAVFRSKLFIQNENKAFLFTDYKLPEISPIIKVKPMSEYEDFIKGISSDVLIDIDSISLYDYNLLQSPKPVRKNPAVKMASIKNKFEINHYKDSFRRLDYALFGFRDKIKEGLSEFELNGIFEKELIREGAFCTSFKTILAIDDNSSIIHYTANSKDKFLKKGSIILLDCGGYYEGGYATDITRVFVCGAPLNEEIKEIYTAVLKAQLNVYNSKLLMSDELDNLAKKILKKYEKKGFYFPHGLGHGIGIPVHQFPPILSNRFKIKIRNGNVFTVEPGLYCAGKFGIRLENTVYLDKGEKISLSHFPYEENLINYDILNKKEQKWLLNWQEASKRI